MKWLNHRQEEHTGNNRLSSNQTFIPFLSLHSFTASLKPWQRVRSDCPWAHRIKSLISNAQGPVGSLAAGAGGAAAGAGAAAAGAGVLDPPDIMEVTPAPTTWPTADPIATPPAVAAI